MLRVTKEELETVKLSKEDEQKIDFLYTFSSYLIQALKSVISLDQGEELILFTAAIMLTAKKEIKGSNADLLLLFEKYLKHSFEKLEKNKKNKGK